MSVNHVMFELLLLYDDIYLKNHTYTYIHTYVRTYIHTYIHRYIHHLSRLLCFVLMCFLQFERQTNLAGCECGPMLPVENVVHGLTKASKSVSLRCSIPCRSLWVPTTTPDILRYLRRSTLSWTYPNVRNKGNGLGQCFI